MDTQTLSIGVDSEKRAARQAKNEKLLDRQVGLMAIHRDGVDLAGGDLLLVITEQQWHELLRHFRDTGIELQKPDEARLSRDGLIKREPASELDLGY